MDDSPLKSFFRNKWVRIFLILDILIVIAFIVIIIINTTKTSTITLDVTPLDAKIQLNGIGYQNGTVAITPGTYEVKISRDGLDSKSFSVTLETGDNLTVAAFLKSGADDFSFYKLKENLDSFFELENIASANNNQTYDKDSSAEAFITYYRGIYNTLNRKFPIEHQEYSETANGRELVKDITIKPVYDEECKTSTCIRAFMLGTDDKDYIKSLIEKKGLKVEDYEVYYKVY